MLSVYEQKITGLMPWGNSAPDSGRHDIRPNYLDLSMNFNNIPCKHDMAIIVTSWWGQLLWLKAALTGYRLSGKYVICAYDCPFQSWGDEKFKEIFPTRKIWLLAHSWVFKHPTFDTNKREGWFWDIYYAKGVISQFKNFKYILHTNGDCIWEKPEGVNGLIELLGDGDLTAISSDIGTIHTAAVLYKVDSFHAIFDYIFNRMKTSIVGSRSPEEMLKEAVTQLKMVEVKAPKQPMEPDNSSVDHYCRYNQPSTWKDIVGFRNLGSEYLTCQTERKEPPDQKYCDTDFSNLFYVTGGSPLFDYYKTGDRCYLYMLYDHNEDSWYDRLHYPLEHYRENEEYYRIVHGEK